MTDAPDAPVARARLLGDLAELFLAGAPAGAAVRLEVLDDGGLLLRSDAVPADLAGEPPPAAWPPAWGACLARLAPWRLERRHRGRRHVTEGPGTPPPTWSDAGPADGEGVALSFRVRTEAVTGDLQSPEVLYALRDVARRHGSVRFGVRLPAGTRDVMRARAGLDSRPPGERD